MNMRIFVIVLGVCAAGWAGLAGCESVPPNHAQSANGIDNISRNVNSGDEGAVQTPLTEQNPPIRPNYAQDR